jgi:hypothetical protein
MTLLSSATGLLAALKLVPEGKKMTIRTHAVGRARTNVVARLRKEPGGGWDDWQILLRPATADDSVLPATWPHENPAIISSQDLADTLAKYPELWADIED